MNGPIYLLFLCSGFSGLVYQVIWVREFGNIFGNTVYSASLVIAVFMLGLGAGSYVIGTWADRRYTTKPDSLLRAYGYIELMIALLGLAIALFLPHLSAVSALASSYAQNARGWYVLSAMSYVARGAIAVALLAPITLLMGGTLTLLIRHLIRKDLHFAGTRIAVLYGVNTAGAALGCFLTDFALVPAVGLQGTQLAAVALNVVVAVTALVLANRPAVEPAGATPAAPVTGHARNRREAPRKTLERRNDTPTASPHALALIGFALGLSGFAAMGLEILWFRHFELLLGGFRAVFSLLLTVILIGIGSGSLLGGMLQRRTPHPAVWLMGIQAVFVATTLFGLTLFDARSVLDAATSIVPIALEVGVPALLMGFAFPLANAAIQHAEQSVGQRAGVLYLANTIGAVCGSLAAGFFLLPGLGIQGSATLLTVMAALAILPLYVAAGRSSRSSTGVLASSTLVASAAVVLWLQLPANYLITRAQAFQAQGERLLALSEGVSEVVAITEVPDEGRQLLTNGHPMSSTNPMSQRYMRALAHVPLLSLGHPARRVLVIGFGVGETLHAFTLHTDIPRIELADLSTSVLNHAEYFRETNKDALENPRVVVHVNDGRQHLRMQPEATYDVIALEPPPITHAGVGALYSKEFYALARTRLTPEGYISQWLPAYQVPAETTLAMVRAFVDVFPQAVLLSGADAELLLIGTNGARIEIDPDRVAAALARDSGVLADLKRLDLGTPRELVGTFVGSPQTLAEGTRGAAPVTDDRPMQEYAAQSRLTATRSGVPAALIDLGQVAQWCPKCFVEGAGAPSVDGLDSYLALLAGAYKGLAPPLEGRGGLGDARVRQMVKDSAYLMRMLPDAHALVGQAYATAGRLDEAVAVLREGLKTEPNSGPLHMQLGNALAAKGSLREAIEQLELAVRLSQDSTEARYGLANARLRAQQYDAAVREYRILAPRMPASSELHNNLGTALAAQSKFDEAIAEFRQALRLRPEFADAQQRLVLAVQAKGRTVNSR